MARAAGETTKKRGRRGLTADQQEYLEVLEARCEDLRRHRPLDDGEQEWIEAELERLEADRDWIVFDLIAFGAWLQEPPRASRRGRPRDPEIAARGKAIAAYSLLLENEMQAKTAVFETMKLFRVPRSTVFLERKRWGPQLKRLGLDRLPAAKRKNKIRYFQQLGSDPLFWSS